MCEETLAVIGDDDGERVLRDPEPRQLLVEPLEMSIRIRDVAVVVVEHEGRRGTVEPPGESDGHRARLVARVHELVGVRGRDGDRRLHEVPRVRATEAVHGEHRELRTRIGSIVLPRFPERAPLEAVRAGCELERDAVVFGAREEVAADGLTVDVELGVRRRVRRHVGLMGIGRNAPTGRTARPGASSAMRRWDRRSRARAGTSESGPSRTGRGSRRTPGRARRAPGAPQRDERSGAVARSAEDLRKGLRLVRDPIAVAMTPSEGGDTPVIRDAWDGSVIGACV